MPNDSTGAISVTAAVQLQRAFEGVDKLDIAGRRLHDFRHRLGHDRVCVVADDLLVIFVKIS